MPAPVHPLRPAHRVTAMPPPVLPAVGAAAGPGAPGQAFGRPVQALQAPRRRRRTRDEDDAAPVVTGDLRRPRLEPAARPLARRRRVVASAHAVLTPGACAEGLRALLARLGAGVLPESSRVMRQVHQFLLRHPPSPHAWSEMDVAALFAPVLAAARAWPFEKAAAVAVILRGHLAGSRAAGLLARRVLDELVDRFDARHAELADVAGTPGHLQRIASAQAALESVVERARELLAASAAGAQAGRAVDELLGVIARLSEALVPQPVASVSGDTAGRLAGKALARLGPRSEHSDAVRAGCELALSLGGNRRSAEVLDAVIAAWAAHQHPAEQADSEPMRRTAFLRGFLLARGEEVGLRRVVDLVLRGPAPVDSDDTQALPLDQLVEALGRAVCIDRQEGLALDGWIAEVFAEPVAPAQGLAGTTGRRCPPAALGLAMAATVRLAGGPSIAPQHLDHLLDVVLTPRTCEAEDRSLMACLAVEGFTSSPDPLDDRVVRSVVARLAPVSPGMSDGRRARLAAALVVGRPEVEALAWQVAAGRLLDAASFARWLDALAGVAGQPGMTARARAVLAAIVHPQARCQPWQVAFLVCCLDRWLARQGASEARRALASSCGRPPVGEASAGHGGETDEPAWRAAARRGLRLAAEPLDVLDDPDLTAGERVALLGHAYALPGVLTADRAGEHVRRVIGRAASAPPALFLLDPLLQRAPVLVPLFQLPALRDCAAAWLQSAAPAPAGAADSASTVGRTSLTRSQAWHGSALRAVGGAADPWAGPGLAEQIGRLYRAVIEAWQDFAAVHADSAAPDEATAAQAALAVFAQTEARALQAASVPQALRDELQPVIEALLSDLAAVRSTAPAA